MKLSPAESGPDPGAPPRSTRFAALDFETADMGRDSACALSIVGIWVEKGIGLIVPGFVPTPLGNIVEYAPSLNEALVCVGIWAFGLLLFSWMLHLAIPIMSGRFRHGTERARA